MTRQFLECPACGGGASRIRTEQNPEVRRRFLAFGHFWYLQQPDADQLSETYAAAQRLHPERGFHISLTKRFARSH